MARKRPPEQCPGQFSAFPHCIHDSYAYQSASHPAKALLHVLVRQLNGSNNGHLQLAVGYLKGHGWKSADVLQRAKLELLERGLVIKTRQGGLNAGPDRWAVTWLIISNYMGLDIPRGQEHIGAWRRFVPEKSSGHSGARNAPVPSCGTDSVRSAPYGGTKNLLSDNPGTPSAGNNVYNHVITLRTHHAKRIVGKAGKSGIRPPTPTSMGE